MTLKEMKIKVFSLIEEYYPDLTDMAEDEDVLNKINSVINQVQMDLMPFRKIIAYDEIEVSLQDDRELDLKDFLDDCYQIDRIMLDSDYELIDSIMILPDDYQGTFKVFYYKYPKLVKLTYTSTENKDEYDSKFKFDLDKKLLEIMPYGVAADLLKLDMISNYGQHFANRYNELKNSIDPRQTTSSIVISGGVDI